ncbi:MAG: NAD(P)(+) transhydrogenase (Re/Si-specific) subunit beta, partial [Coriobacteriales bacterium]|nr:NAD(P)(+) transhydrogenase (Re/Si-specific) subunit beta [Coriobacteriales bacterium]
METFSMPASLISGAFIISGLLFILSLAGLSRHETSRRGNILGACGMTVALAFTILGVVLGTSSNDSLVPYLIHEAAPNWAIGAILGAMAVGAVIGIIRAKRVEMTQMPELIALFHSFVGLAAVLVGWSAYFGSVQSGHFDGLHSGELFVGIFIG